MKPDSSASKLSYSAQKTNRYEPVIALTPRPKLFYALALVFVAWIGFLLTLYFTTVYHKSDVHLEVPAAGR